MDTQKQEKLKEIELWKSRRYFEPTYEDAEVNIDFLLQFVREQETLINELRADIQKRSWKQLSEVGNKVSLEAKIYALETHLVKYERVVKAAKRLISKARDNKTVTGDNEQPDWYEYTEEDFEALTNAVDDLKA